VSYSVKLDVYEGPLDLLLELVSKQRVEVRDISISTITEEYLQTVQSAVDVDLNTASSFLVLAATLLELKSLRLLPAKPVDEGELRGILEERDHLIHKLIEYSMFKAVAGHLHLEFAANKDFFVRLAGPPQDLAKTSPDILAGLDAAKLASAAQRALSPKQRATVDTTHITPVNISVAEAVAILIRQIEESGVSTFRRLCKDRSNPIEVIVRFLALLEMFKDQTVEIEQKAPFAEIVVRYRSPLAGDE